MLHFLTFSRSNKCVTQPTQVRLAPGGIGLTKCHPTYRSEISPSTTLCQKLYGKYNKVQFSFVLHLVYIFFYLRPALIPFLRIGTRIEVTPG